MHLQYNSKQAGISQAERHIVDTLVRLGKLIVRATDLEEMLGCDRKKANLILSRLCKKGWLQRLKAGVYLMVPMGSQSATPVPEDAWAIAMELFSPCYISGWTAAEHWGLTEQIFNSTVVFTGQKQRRKEITVAGLVYRTKFIAPKCIFGTKKIWSNNKVIFIADLHRMIIDVLDDPTLGGGGRHTIDIMKAYSQHKEADPDLLKEYAEKLGHGAVFKRLGLMAEKLMHLSSPYLEELRSKIGTGIIKFDPNGPNSGPIISKWGIRINIPLGDLS